MEEAESEEEGEEDMDEGGREEDMDKVVALAEAAHHVCELVIVDVVHARPLVREETLPVAEEAEEGG